MYDVSGSDSGREWVEIYNNSGSPVDVSGWKFLETPTSSNHSFTVISGTANLPAGGSAIISNDSSKFLLDWPAFTGNLFKASFSSLSNTSSTVVLKDGSLNIIDQVTYNSEIGANGDGNSLQKAGTSWVALAPTPGSQSSSSSTSTSTQTQTQATSTTQSTSTSSSSTISDKESSHSSPASISKTDEKIKLEISAGRDRLTTVGNKLNFRVAPTKIVDFSEQYVSYFWSFGDGTTAQGKIVDHSYKFPGEYVVIVNASVSDVQAVSRIIVKVFSPELTLIKTSEGIEIGNKSKSEINLDSWSILSNKKSFNFPKDTIILPGKKIIFGSEVTGISTDEFELDNPLGKGVLFVEKSEIVIPQTSSNISTTSLEFNISNKIVELNKEISQLIAVPVIKQKKFSRKIFRAKDSAPLVVTTLGSSTPLNLSQTATVIKVFEAPQNRGVAERVLSWPVNGFNFIKHLFVEN